MAPGAVPVRRNPPRRAPGSGAGNPATGHEGCTPVSAATSTPWERNLREIEARIAAAAARAGRAPESVRLIAVTKEAPAAAVAALHALGLRHFGENRVHVAAGKRAELGGLDAVWHMIGNVQRRKAGEVARTFDRVDAVDRVALAEALQRQCEALDRVLPVLIEVNVSGEPNKHGCAPAELAALLRAVAPLDRLRVEGLMTMAPFDAPGPVLRAVFGGLRRLAEEQGLPTLSMGMTDDFETAIEEGATEVRIGRALFETDPAEQHGE